MGPEIKGEWRCLLARFLDPGVFIYLEIGVAR